MSYRLIFYKMSYGSGLCFPHSFSRSLLRVIIPHTHTHTHTQTLSAMADLDDIKQSFDELAGETTKAMGGGHDTELLKAAEKLLCCEKFEMPQTLRLFMDAMQEEVGLLREHDKGIKDYLKFVDSCREAQKQGRCTDRCRIMKKAKLEGLQEKVQEINSEDDAPEPELPRKKKAELREAKNKAVLRTWALLLEKGARSDVIRAELVRASGNDAHHAVKRLLELHAFSFDLHSSLRGFHEDATQSTFKKDFIAKLTHCIAKVTSDAYGVVPPSMMAVLSSAMDVSSAGVIAPVPASDAPASAASPLETGLAGPKSFTAALKALRTLLRGSDDTGDAAGSRASLEPDYKARIATSPKSFPQRKRTALSSDALELEPAEVCKRRLLECIMLRPREGAWKCCTEPGALSCRCLCSCNHFLDYFFELPQLSSKPSKAELLLHDVRKDAFLERVSSASSKNAGGDLRAAMKKELGVMHQGRPGGSALKWSPLGEVAVDVMLEVLEEEWQSAKTSAENEEGFQGAGHRVVFPLRRGTYAIERFRRVVRACEFLSYDSRKMYEILGQISPLSQDLRDIMQFAEGCVARAFIYEVSDKGTKKQLVEDILVELESFSTLNGGMEQSQEALCTLRCFFRIAVRRSFPVEREREEKLRQLQLLEQDLFTPAPPRSHFASRLPMLILSKIWPRVYGKLTEKRPELLQLPHRQLELLFEKLDLPSLLRGICYDSCGEEFEDSQGMKGLVARFGDTMQTIIYCDYIKCMSSRSKDEFAEESWRRCYYLNDSERDCWQDPTAQELLRQLFLKGRKRFFVPPFLGTFRSEQLFRELGGKGVVLLNSPYTKPREPSVECALRFPLQSRIFARAHSPYFKILPVFYLMKITALKRLILQIREAGASAWCVGSLHKVTGDHVMNELFKNQYVPLDKNQGQDLGCVFDDLQASHLAARKLAQAVSKAQRSHFGETLLRLRGSPQTEEWTLRLEEVISDDPGVVNVVIFSTEEKSVWGDGVLSLSANHKDDARLQALFKERRLTIFLEEARAEQTLMFKLREDLYTPCYKFGNFLSTYWSEAHMKIVQDLVNDKEKVALIKHGVKAVLFSDVASGLINEEVACRLPKRLYMEKKLLHVLALYGISLYVWGLGVARGAPKTPYQLLEEPRELTFDMIFDESENLYDHSVFHRADEDMKARVKKRVSDCLHRQVPEDGFSEVPAAGDGAVTDGSVLAFLRADQLKVRDNESHLSWAIMRAFSPKAPLVLLSPNTPPTNVLLSLPNMTRVYQRRCVGPQCRRPATREVDGARKTIVCETCSPWKSIESEWASFAACEFCETIPATEFSKQSLQLCGKPAALQLHGQEEAAPQYYCLDHAKLTSPSPDDLAGCAGGGSEKALLFHEVSSSLNVFQPDSMAECYKFNSLKVSGHLFADSKIVPGCLEVQMLLEGRLRSFLTAHDARMRKVELFLTRDALTAHLVTICLREMGLQKPLVWSLDYLSTLTEGDFDKTVKRHPFLRTREKFLEALEGDVKQVQWIRDAYLEAGPVQCRGDGELPHDKKESERREGLFVQDAPAGVLEELPRVLQLQLKNKSPEVQMMQGPLVEKMWRLHALANRYFASSEALTEVSFVDSSKPSPFVDAMGVGWLCVCRVFQKTDAASQAEASKRGQCWGDVLGENLDSAMQFLRRQMMWKCAPQLSAVARYGAHSGCWEESTTTSRPPLYVDVLEELDFHADPAIALEEMRMVEERFQELLEKGCRCASPTLAIGVVNSVCLNYKASLRARGLGAATPAAFVRNLLEPRLEQIGGLYDLVSILFQDEAWEKNVDLRRVPLKIKHVTMLAQEFFWAPSFRLRLQTVMKEIKHLFETESTPVPKRTSLLDSCFGITGTTFDHEKHDWKGRCVLVVE